MIGGNFHSPDFIIGPSQGHQFFWNKYFFLDALPVQGPSQKNIDVYVYIYISM